MFCTFPLVLSAVCVQCPTWLFSLWWLDFVLFRFVALMFFFFNDFEMVLVVPFFFTGITFAFTFFITEFLL